jgi:hypothetical protein
MEGPVRKGRRFDAYNGKKGNFRMNVEDDSIGNRKEEVSGLPGDRIENYDEEFTGERHDDRKGRNAVPPRGFVKPNTFVNLEELLSPFEKEKLMQEKTRYESIKGMLLETINILYREYNVRSLKFFRRRIEDCQTTEELVVAANLLMTLGRYHEMSGPPAYGTAQEEHVVDRS